MEIDRIEGAAADAEGSSDCDCDKLVRFVFVDFKGSVTAGSDLGSTPDPM